jgi:hypothetical protein
VQGEEWGGGATFNRVNICTNQNETLMKQIQNSQKSVAKSIPAKDLKISRKKSENQKSQDFCQI